jgi:hypothetical protein
MATDDVCGVSLSELYVRTHFGGVVTSRADHQHTPDAEAAIREAALDKTLADTFPASDPLSSNPNPCDESIFEADTAERLDAPRARPN